MTNSRLSFAVASAFLFCAAAQQTTGPLSIPRSGNPAIAARVAQRSAGTTRNAYIFSTAVVFPQLAVGSGTGESWQTSFVIVNMSGSAVTFGMRFFDNDGAPMTVSFTTGKAVPAASDVGLTATLAAFGSTTITVYDDGQALRTGWAIIEPPSDTIRLGGYAVFRQTVPGRPVFESVVPLCDYDDYASFMPFNNASGIDTGMALVNPSSSLDTTVYLVFLDETGATMFEESFTLKPKEHTSFSLTTKYPALAGKTGTVYVEGSSDYLSALGLRFNLAGGGAFTSLPVMNWAGMYQQ